MTKAKFESTTFWCKFKGLFISYFVSWCVHTQGGRMLHDHFDLIKREIEDLPGSVIKTDPHYNIVKDYLEIERKNLKAAMLKEIEKW